MVPRSTATRDALVRDQQFETLKKGGRQAGRWCFDSAGPVGPREKEVPW